MDSINFSFVGDAARLTAGLRAVRGLVAILTFYATGKTNYLSNNLFNLRDVSGRGGTPQGG
jgi:hypothetical protein